MLEAAKEAAARARPFPRTLAPAPDRQLNPNGGFPLAVEDGLFYARPGSQLVSIDGAIILPRAPEEFSQGPARRRRAVRRAGRAWGADVRGRLRRSAEIGL